MLSLKNNFNSNVKGYILGKVEEATVVCKDCDVWHSIHSTLPLRDPALWASQEPGVEIKNDRKPSQIKTFKNHLLSIKE